MTIHRRTTVALALLIVSGSLACASSGGTTTRGSRNVITLEELANEPSGTLYEAIQRLRPRWLQNRGISNSRTLRPTPLQVYLDNAPLGTTGSLRTISVTDVDRVEFMSANDATTRFGTGHDGGAIIVSTRTGT